MKPPNRAAWWHSRPLRKVLTKPLWWWQKRRPWPIRGRVFRLPPHPVPPETRVRLAVLTTPAGVPDAAWAAYSFLHRLDRAPAARLGLDLYLDSPDAAVLQQTSGVWNRLFPGARVFSTWQAVDALESAAPTLATLAKTHPMARKLCVALHAQNQTGMIFSDSDVLILGDSPELAAAAQGTGPALFNQEISVLNVDEKLLAHARRVGWPPPPDRFNSGLLYLPQRYLAIADAENILALGVHDPTSYFVDQTILALLLGAKGASPLPPERYLVSPEGQFFGEQDADYDRLSARHFTTPVRHLMYSQGMPLLWRQWHGKSP